MENLTAEQVLDKYYPSERTVFREAILKAMEEYATQKEEAAKTVLDLINKEGICFVIPRINEAIQYYKSLSQ